MGRLLLAMRPWAKHLFAGGVLAGAVIASACKEPVHDAQVRALGDEIDGVAPDQHHRAGQPCVVCHGDIGPAEQRFSVAGTVFFGPTKLVGQEGVEVLMVDSLGSSPNVPVVTNCVGNFFVTPEQWSPAFPILVKIKRGQQEQVMQSHISRDGSCASCHRNEVDIDSAGPVYLVNANDEKAQEAPRSANCPVNPDITPRRGN
jgi:hypothetical protein